MTGVYRKRSLVPQIRRRPFVFTTPPTIYEVTGSGTVAFSGNASVAKTRLYEVTGSGTITFDGAAFVGGLFSFTGAGTIVFSGTASINRTIVYIPTGSITFSDSAGVSLGKAFTGSGVITFEGSSNSVVLHVFPVTGAGTIIFTGTAEAFRSVSHIPTGGVTFSGSGIVSASFAQATVNTIEGVTRNDIFKRFLRETGLGVYGVVTGIGGGSTTTFDDINNLKSGQFNKDDWVGAWARISKNLDSKGNVPEGEVFSVTNYDPTTNGRITAGTFSAAIGVGDEYELWRFPNPNSVVDDLDTILQEEIYLPCWSVLSDIPDFDMEQSGTDDWSAITGTISKVSSAPYLSGKRYLAVTASVGVGLCRSGREIKVEPGKRYHLSAVGFADDDGNTLTLGVYDVTNDVVLDDTVSWNRQYPGRLVLEFTVPSNCYSIKVNLAHASSGAAQLAYWDEVCFYQTDGNDILLPWWVKNKNQVKGIFRADLTQLDSNVYDYILKGPMINSFDIRDDAFGSGQLRLVSPTGGIAGPIFIFGVRNETAFDSDNGDTKRLDENLIIAALACKVLKRLKTFPNSNAMQTNWVIEQYTQWEKMYRNLARQQSERIEAIIQTVQGSGYYRDSRMSFGNS